MPAGTRICSRAIFLGVIFKDSQCATGRRRLRLSAGLDCNRDGGRPSVGEGRDLSSSASTPCRAAWRASFGNSTQSGYL